MANFASTAYVGDILNPAQLKLELEGSLPVKVFSYSQNSNVSTSSTSPASLWTNVVSLASDEVAVFYARTSVSVGTPGNYVLATLNVNGSDLGLEQSYYEPSATGRTSGEDVDLSDLGFASGLSGSINFSVNWRTTGGTVYSLLREMRIAIFKLRS